MAVYTEISDDDLNAFIADYGIGEVLSCKGIAEGVENSNYLLVTDQNPFILTLYEKRVDPRICRFFSVSPNTCPNVVCRARRRCVQKMVKC